MQLKHLLIEVEGLNPEAEIVPKLVENPDYVATPDGALITQPTHMLVLVVGTHPIAIKTKRNS